jgi:hypothetical protein
MGQLSFVISALARLYIVLVVEVGTLPLASMSNVALQLTSHRKFLRGQEKAMALKQTFGVLVLSSTLCSLALSLSKRAT